MHIKIIDGNDCGEPPAQLIKASSRGLRGNDLSEFIKRAGHEMADIIAHTKFASGEIPIHLIAMGASEYYGCNRNFDGFTEAALKKYHKTFEKCAKWYRAHINKDPLQSYGIIKASIYNEPMHRVELLVALNGTKEAAERNKGLVADEEMNQLEKNADGLGVSMSCRVPYDECSGCHHKAKTRAEYCTADMCKAGGLKYNIGRVDDSGNILYADNPDPCFFDISKVWRPADRIAYVLGKVK